MDMLSKGCKPDNFESYNFLKLSFMNITGLHSNSVDCESFLKSNCPDILPLCETNLDNSVDSGNFFGRSYLPLIQKDSTTHMAGFAVYTEGMTSFCTKHISRKLCRFLFIFSTGFTSLSVLLLFPLFVTFFIVICSFLIPFHLT